MDTFLLNADIRALYLLGILGLITLGILWGGGRLLRNSVGNLWWLRSGPKIVYSILLVLGLPAALIARYGIVGLQVYVVAGIFAATVLFVAGLIMLRH